MSPYTPRGVPGVEDSHSDTLSLPFIRFHFWTCPVPSARSQMPAFQVPLPHGCRPALRIQIPELNPDPQVWASYHRAGTAFHLWELQPVCSRAPSNFPGLPSRRRTPVTHQGWPQAPSPRASPVLCLWACVFEPEHGNIQWSPVGSICLLSSRVPTCQSLFGSRMRHQRGLVCFPPLWQPPMKRACFFCDFTSRKQDPHLQNGLGLGSEIVPVKCLLPWEDAGQLPKWLEPFCPSSSPWVIDDRIAGDQASTVPLSPSSLHKMTHWIIRVP